MEIVAGQNVSHSCQFAFGKDIGIAECLLVNPYSACEVTVPDNFTPVDTTAVNRTSVIEYYSFYRFHCGNF